MTALLTRDAGYRRLAFVLRTGGDPQALIPDVRLAIRPIDPRLVAADIAGATRPPRGGVPRDGGGADGRTGHGLVTMLAC